jgi:dienelactone hydrolase
MPRIFLVTLLATCSAFAADHFVYPLPPDSTLSIQRDQVYKTTDGQSLHFDLYRPANSASSVAPPVVVFMQGVGGGDVRTWAQYTGWGKLVTTIGMAGIVYDSHEGAVTKDAADLLSYLKRHAAELHIDADTIVLWACSANARAGLPFAMDARQTAIKAAVFYYGALDEAKDLRMDLPILIVRSGLDGAGLNKGIDQLVARASATNVPMTFLNMPGAHHAFDVRDDNDTSRAVIARTLDFMKTQISPAAQRAIRDAMPDAAATAAVYRQDWPAALKAYEALTKTRPDDSELHRNYGNALLGLAEYQRALTEYERALALGNPNQGWIRYAAATASMKLGNSDAALDWIEKLKDIMPMRRQLKCDPTFAALKDNPRFKAVAEMQ